MTTIQQGDLIGDYRVVRLLGEGGMGMVFEVVNDTIEHRAAIKVLKPSCSKDQEILGRFFNEARAVNIIRHPGIVSISEFGALDSGVAYIVMEYLEGESLRARLRRGSPRVDALRVARQIASALSAAHAKSIIHRDLKPDNVMLVKDPDMPGGERVKVLDFGIAKLAEGHSPPGVGVQPNTKVGITIGTPVYMAPEQCLGRAPVTDRADVYSLGVVLYHMLSGAPPFHGPMADAVMAMHIEMEPPPLETAVPGLAPGVASLVRSMLDKDPRYRPSMQDVAGLLDQLGATSGALLAAPRSASGRRPMAQDVPVQASTLRQAAAESVIRRSTWSGPRITAVSGGGMVLIALAALLWLRSRGDGPPVPAEAPVATGRLLARASSAEPHGEAANSQLRLSIRTTPPSSSILVDGLPCANPCELRRPPGSSVHIAVRRRGHLPYETDLRMDKDTVLPIALVQMGKERDDTKGKSQALGKPRPVAPGPGVRPPGKQTRPANQGRPSSEIDPEL